MSFPRYPKYKASGVEWLGEVPEHWGVKPVRQLASVVNGFPFDSKLFDATEGIPLIRIRDLNQAETDTCYKGEFIERAAITSDDVLIGMDGDFNVGRWRGKGRALLNQRMCCIRGNSSLLTRLLEYSLPIPLKAINAVTYATTVKHLASSQIEKTFVALPPNVEEQTAIAGFLDRETAKIDGLVAEQRRLMELLKEKRQAVISHAVTKGLNPHAPMKPSGIAWLGDVPVGWGVQRVKFAAKMDSGHTPSRAVPEYWENCTIPWVSLNDTKTLKVNDYIEETAIEISELGMANSSAHLISAGSVVFTRDATIGLTAILTRPMAVSQHVITWTPNPTKLTPEFLLRVFGAMEQYLDSFTMGSTIKTIGMPDVRKLTFALPPLDEQIDIVAFIGEALSRLDTLTAEAQRAIDLLQERRTALISAAVTGQIDVRQ